VAWEAMKRDLGLIAWDHLEDIVNTHSEVHTAFLARSKYNLSYQ